MINNKKHIIFDWNGTLVDDAWIFVDILNVLLKSRNIQPITIEQYRNQFCFPIKQFYEKIGISHDSESFLRLEKDFIKEYKARMYLPGLFSDTITTLKMLLKREIEVSILSASNQTILENLVTHYQIKKFFHYICGVDNYGANGKLENGVDLLKKINYDKKNILIVGDTDYDYKVAKTLGVDCVLISSGHQSEKRLRCVGNNLIKSIAELENYNLYK